MRKSLVLGLVWSMGCVGPQGPAGETGAVGAAGATGATGPTGAAGDQGPAGPKGDEGAAGDPGDEGPQGDPGDEGPQGDPGEDGEDGLSYPSGLSLVQVGRYTTGVFEQGAAEIVAFDAATDRVFVVNAAAATVDVLDATDPTELTLEDTLDAADHAGTAVLGSANSVAVNGGLLAVAVEADPKTDDGVVQFYDTTTLAFLGSVEVCALPDNVVFSPDGLHALVACEGEPNDDYDVDPEGAIAVIDLSSGAASASVDIADFHAFDGDIVSLRAAGVRIYGPGASVSQDLEPEYVAVSADSTTAYVTLQENNAVAIVDVVSATVSDIVPLGTKDWSLPGQELDPSDRDGGVHFGRWPVRGMYQPDTIAAYDVFGTPYLVTANEGDARDYDGFGEEARVKDVDLDPTRFPTAAALQTDGQIGRLRITEASGDTDDDGDFDVLYAYGARSFSIWNGETGRLVFDSGDAFERLLAVRYGAEFNQDHTADGGDARSDDKGCEPEGLAVGRVGLATYAFVGLERMGGIMVYDITFPDRATFVQYTTNRDVGTDPENGAVDIGDLGPEGLSFVAGSDTPTGRPWLIVGNEVSGSTTIYEVRTIGDE